MEAAFGARPVKAVLGLDLVCIFDSEDTVCGSAHCQIAAFLAKQLNKKEIYAYQASRRGGYLYCRMEESADGALADRCLTR